jgi:hypothetical protein
VYNLYTSSKFIMSLENIEVLSHYHLCYVPHIAVGKRNACTEVLLWLSNGGATLAQTEGCLQQNMGKLETAWLVRLITYHRKHGKERVSREVIVTSAMQRAGQLKRAFGTMKPSYNVAE